MNMDGKVIYYSANEDKINEIEEIGRELNFPLQCERGLSKINEIQTSDIHILLRDKTERAYKKVRRPVIVEHTVLEIECINEHPGTQTEIFWKQLGAERIVNIVKHLSNSVNNAKAKSYFAYFDGKNYRDAFDEIKGEIVSSEDEIWAEGFEWDKVFIPDNQDGLKKTFAELQKNNQKIKFSMRKNALEKLKHKLEEIDNDSFSLYDIGVNPLHVAEIAKKAKEDKLVLFIGAGLSKNVDMPSWGGLIDKLGENLGYEKGMFSLTGNDDYLALAEYYQEVKGNGMEQVIDYFKEANSAQVNNQLQASNIYKNVTKIPVHRIYTTNYEHLIENAYSIHTDKQVKTVYDLQTYNQEKADVEVIKLHGDVDKPETIVLTQNSYFERYDMETPLDILLRNDLLDKTFLFIGYSFRDVNVQYMFYKLNKLWGKEDIKDRPTSYIFLSENEPVQRHLLKNNYKIEPIISEIIDKKNGLEDFLEKVVKACEC